ncbi:hypothetical protein COT30_01540 [Candidatus Micrarchaeota archaeon CG08_land_8_20_14_0_20_49_17]|nr:MAG: hypothetical protein COT30_01540 [Candidatus Micrarchaeota archaeon CG08_land_8_20_14_0_20_49_17]
MADRVGEIATIKYGVIEPPACPASWTSWPWTEDATESSAQTTGETYEESQLKAADNPPSAEAKNGEHDEQPATEGTGAQTSESTKTQTENAASAELNKKLIDAAGISEPVSVLIARGADVDAKDERGWTKLYHAVVNRDVKEVRALIENNANVNEKTNNGWTALNYAAGNGHAEIVKILLENGADVTITDNEGQVALHYAAGNGHAEIVKILLENGADVSITDNKGKTASDWATEYGNPEAAAVLTKAADAAAAQQKVPETQQTEANTTKTQADAQKTERLARFLAAAAVAPLKTHEDRQEPAQQPETDVHSATTEPLMEPDVATATLGNAISEIAGLHDACIGKKRLPRVRISPELREYLYQLDDAGILQGKINFFLVNVQALSRNQVSKYNTMLTTMQMQLAAEHEKYEGILADQRAEPEQESSAKPPDAQPKPTPTGADVQPDTEPELPIGTKLPNAAPETTEEESTPAQQLADKLNKLSERARKQAKGARIVGVVRNVLNPVGFFQRQCVEKVHELNVADKFDWLYFDRYRNGILGTIFGFISGVVVGSTIGYGLNLLFHQAVGALNPAKFLATGFGVCLGIYNGWTAVATATVTKRVNRIISGMDEHGISNIKMVTYADALAEQLVLVAAAGKVEISAQDIENAISNLTNTSSERGMRLQVTEPKFTDIQLTKMLTERIDFRIKRAGKANTYKLVISFVGGFAAAGIAFFLGGGFAHADKPTHTGGDTPETNAPSTSEQPDAAPDATPKQSVPSAEQAQTAPHSEPSPATSGHPAPSAGQQQPTPEPSAPKAEAPAAPPKPSVPAQPAPEPSQDPQDYAHGKYQVMVENINNIEPENLQGKTLEQVCTGAGMNAEQTQMMVKHFGLRTPSGGLTVFDGEDAENFHTAISQDPTIVAKHILFAEQAEQLTDPAEKRRILTCLDRLWKQLKTTSDPMVGTPAEQETLAEYSRVRTAIARLSKASVNQISFAPVRNAGAFVARALTRGRVPI